MTLLEVTIKPIEKSFMFTMGIPVFFFLLFIILIPPGLRYRGFIDRTLQHTEGDPIREFIRFIIL